MQNVLSAVFVSGGDPLNWIIYLLVFVLAVFILLYLIRMFRNKL